MRTVRLVDTLDATRAACERLRASKLLALDVEWEAEPQPQVALLQLAGDGEEELIYVFDALALGQRLFDALLPLLADPAVLKLCFDCRGDASVLFHRHRVRMHSVYDLQIVYASLYAHKHGDGFLRGLHRALECALSPEDARAFAQRKATQKRRFEAGAPLMMARPLTSETLEYAAHDVAHLFELHRLWAPHFTKRAVLAASTRRMLCSMHGPTPAASKSRIDFPLVRPLRLAFVHHHRNPDDAAI